MRGNYFYQNTLLGTDTLRRSPRLPAQKGEDPLASQISRNSRIPREKLFLFDVIYLAASKDVAKIAVEKMSVLSLGNW